MPDLDALLSRYDRSPDYADVTGTAYDVNGPIWRMLGKSDRTPVNEPRRGALESPTAASDYTWERTPGSPYELPRWRQRYQDAYEAILGAPGVDTVMTATNFMVPRPGVMAIPKMPKKPQGIRAYHGSPHDFDRFELSSRTRKTGEGAAAYGDGLYFAENEGVARQYREDLSRGARTGTGPGRHDVFEIGNKEVPASQKSAADIAHMVQEYKIDLSKRDGQEWLSSEIGARGLPSETRDVVTEFLRQPINKKTVDGRMYEVNINANPEHFLDWDKPLAGQSEKVRAGMRNAFGPLPDNAKMGGFDIPSPPGPAQTRLLKDAGVPGIRYKDAGSRFNPASLPDNPIANEARRFLAETNGDSSAAYALFHKSNPVERWAAPERDEISKVIKASGVKPTHNYVLFDDSVVDILRKYGIGGVMAAGAYGNPWDRPAE